MDRWIRIGLPLVWIGIGAILLFKNLEAMGITSDEFIDYSISLSYRRNLVAVLENTLDPSQSRLPHVIGALGLWLFDSSLHSYKLTFALVGGLTAVLLFLICRTHLKLEIALYTTAIFLLCPYGLAAYRTTASAGDGLVITTWLLVGIALTFWTQTHKWIWAAATGAALGLAIGAKLTGILLILLILGVVGLQIPRLLANFDRSRWQIGLSVVGFTLAFLLVVFIANPLFLHGPGFTIEALQEVTRWSHRETYAFLGVWRERAQLDYLFWIFVGKFSPGLCLAAALGLTLLIRSKLPSKRTPSLLQVQPNPHPSWLWIFAGMMGLSLLHFVRSFQNAQYYVGAVPGMVILAGYALDQIQHRYRRPSSQWLGIVIPNLLLLSMVITNLYLQDNYLLAGRSYGSWMQGGFQGPAVNHCQGSPRLIEHLNRHLQDQPDHPIFVFVDCLGAWKYAETHGSIKTQFEWRELRTVAPLPPHAWVVVAATYDYSAFSVGNQKHRAMLKHNQLKNCEQAFDLRGIATVYQCSS